MTDRLLDRPIPDSHANAGTTVAATILGGGGNGPANFTINGGDGRILRGLWEGVPPKAGQQAAATFDDDGNAWLRVWENGKGTVQVISEAVANVRLKGAVGDGEADDTAAIQAAVASLPASGGEVFFPAGTYRITATITLPNFVVIDGVGQGATIRCNGNFYAFSFSPGNRSHVRNVGVEATTVQLIGGAFDFTNAAFNVRITDIWLGNNLHTSFNMTATQASGHYFLRRIRATGVVGHNTIFRIGNGTQLITDIHLADILVNGANDDGSGIQNFMIVKNNVDTLWMNDLGCLKAVNGMTLGEVASGAVTDSKLRLVMIDGCAKQGIKAVKTRGCIISDVQLQTNGDTAGADPQLDIGANCTGMQVVGGTIQNGHNDGIKIRNGAIHTTILGVNVSDNNTSNTAGMHGISVTANASQWKIMGCTIGNNMLLTGGHQKYGINVAAGTGNEYIIADNTFAGNDTGTINNGATGATSAVHHNIP